MNRDIWLAAQQALQSGEPALLAVVCENGKGSPGTQKAALLLDSKLRHTGTIGGGIMERRLVQGAAAKLRDPGFSSLVQRVDHLKNSHAPSGLICGGWQRNAQLKLLPERDLEPLNRICEAAAAGASGAVSIGSAGLQFAANRPIEAADTRFDQTAEDWTFQFNLQSAKRVAIFGAGHCGRALALQMVRLDYSVALFDERPITALADPKHSISLHQEGNAEAFAAQFADWPRRYAIVMTHSYPTDLRALLAALPRKPLFTGLMGSQPKLKKIFAELRLAGMPPASLAAITAPVGLPIGSDTPEEIAVSVAAQIVQHKKELSCNERPN